MPISMDLDTDMLPSRKGFDSDIDISQYIVGGFYFQLPDVDE